MSPRPTLPADTEPAEGPASASAAWSLRDHAAQPARALGPKASLRQTRRCQHGPALRGATSAPRAAPHFQTSDAAVTFVFKACGSALYVERIQRRPIGTHLIQCMVFSAAEEFMHWCDVDPVRFDDPGLHQRLVRHGREYFGDRH